MISLSRLTHLLRAGADWLRRVADHGCELYDPLPAKVLAKVPTKPSAHILWGDACTLGQVGSGLTLHTPNGPVPLGKVVGAIKFTPPDPGPFAPYIPNLIPAAPSEHPPIPPSVFQVKAPFVWLSPDEFLKILDKLAVKKRDRSVLRRELEPIGAADIDLDETRWN